MSGVFGASYADAYDALYADKDYDAECDLVQLLASRYGIGAASILDLGCGTGRHAVALAARGCTVTGVDVSADMLLRAEARAESAGVSVDFVAGDVRDVRLGRRFDVVLLMFAVLGYQLDDHDVEAALATAAEHLRPGGVVIFDVWNGPAVEAIGPTTRTKAVAAGGGQILRTARGTLDTRSRTCIVEYGLEWVVDGNVVRTAKEQHRMRYFFEAELRAFARGAGCEITHASAFPDADRPANSDDWNALYVARSTGRT